MYAILCPCLKLVSSIVSDTLVIEKINNKAKMKREKSVGVEQACLWLETGGRCLRACMCVGKRKLKGKARYTDTI